MCLLVVAWNAHPRYRLILAGNRDEFHVRPAASLAWWQDAPDVLAGRDLEAGGTWLGVSRDGRLGVVTNFRDGARKPPAHAPSRGELTPRFLTGPASARQFMLSLERRRSEYAGFNLLLADRASLQYYSNRVDGAPRALAPGIYGLSNHRLDEPWPKLLRTRDRFTEAVVRERPDAAELFAILADRTMDGPNALDADLPAEWQRAVSAPFVVNERYGTRCTTVVLVGRDGRTTLHERRFDRAGVQTGASRIEFNAEPAREQSGSGGPSRRPDEALALDTSTE